MSVWKQARQTPVKLESKHTYRLSEVGLTANRPARGWITPFDRDIGAHNHDFHEISFVLQGRADHVTDAGTFEISRGDVMIIQPGHSHWYTNFHELVLMNVLYLPEWLLEDLSLLLDEGGIVPLFFSTTLFRTPLYKPTLQFPMLPAYWTEFTRELMDLERERDSATPSKLLLKSSIFRLMRMIAHSLQAHDPEFAKFGLSHEVYLTAQHVEKILREEKPYSEDECARAVGKSQLQHRKSFKDQAGCTPYEYYQQRRMIRARNLLVQSRLNLTEIAMALHFSDSAHFSNSFKTACGIPPLEYRKTFRDNAPK
jgi:AraC-like DNA-binding protein/quercetin dioxygenase-like cupin family protein